MMMMCVFFLQKVKDVANVNKRNESLKNVYIHIIYILYIYIYELMKRTRRLFERDKSDIPIKKQRERERDKR